MYGIYMIATLAIMALSFYLQYKLKNIFQKYATVPTVGNITGAQVAQAMLHDNGITDVKVQQANGFLSDHYNPLDKTVNLSPDVYNGTSVTAAAVAAHECGHAVQHANAYSWLMMRSGLVPMLEVSNRFTPWLLMGGIILLGFAKTLGFWVLLVGVLFFAMTTLFSFITLPVEFDASNRALAWLNTRNVTGLDHDKASEVLKWAGMTYVVAAVGSLIQLLYYAMVLLRSRDR